MSCAAVQGTLGQPRGGEVPGQIAPVDSFAETAGAEAGGGAGAGAGRGVGTELMTAGSARLTEDARAADRRKPSGASQH